MRGALIGCGFFAQNHLNAWRDLRDQGIQIVVVCDIDEEKARAAAETFGIPRFVTDPAAVFEDAKLDFVDIATRMETHRELVALAARHKVRAIVQKPLAPGWDECVEIVRIAREAGIPLAVHENFRYQAPMQAVKRVLESGTIGEPSWGRFSFRFGFDIYKTQPYFHEVERLVILDSGIHILDLARFFLGEVSHLSCETQRRNAKNIGEDTATILMRHASGAVSVVESTYESRQVPDLTLQTLLTIEGTRGSIKLHDDFRMVVTADGEAQECFVGSDLLSWTEQPWHTLQESVRTTQGAIIDAWRAGCDAETSGADNLKTFALVEAAYLAASEKRIVEPLAAS